MTRELARVVTPIGGFRAVVENGALCTAGFVGRTGACNGDSSGVHDVLVAGTSREKSTRSTRSPWLPTDSVFKQLVWKALRGRSGGHDDLLRRAHGPRRLARAARAVGTANTTNPICLVIPCHRVIRTGGELGGYGFGLERKRWLLRARGRPVASS